MWRGTLVIMFCSSKFILSTMILYYRWSLFVISLFCICMNKLPQADCLFLPRWSSARARPSFSNSCASPQTHFGYRIWALFVPTLCLVLLVQIWTNDVHSTSWPFDPYASHLGLSNRNMIDCFFRLLIWATNCNLSFPCYLIFMLSCFILLFHFNFPRFV